MTMDPSMSGMSQGTDGAPSSASAYPVPSAVAEPPFPAPPDIPADEPVLSRMYDILTHPTNIPHYIAHLRGAKWSAIIWLVLGVGIFESVVTAVGTSVLGSSVGNVPGLGQLPSSWQAGFDAAARGSHGNLLTAFVSFFLASGFYWLFAKLFGGQGTFLQSSWLFVLIWAPISAAASLLGLIPVLGLVASFVLAIVQAVPLIYAMAAAHRLTVGKAAVVVLIPFALVFVSTICALGFAAAITASSLGH